MGTPELGLEFAKRVIGLSAPAHKDGLDLNCATRFDSVLQSLSDFEAEPGRLRCRFTVTPAMQNRYATLHGGCIGTNWTTNSKSALAIFGLKGRSAEFSQGWKSFT